MTIIDAINRVDARKPGNQYTIAEKIKWLSDLDGIITRELIMTHGGKYFEGRPPGGCPPPPGGDGTLYGEFPKYNENTDVNTALLADDAYGDLYIYYLEAQIDRCNRELASYNNDMILFNSAYEEYANYYNRTRPPGRKTEVGYRYGYV